MNTKFIQVFFCFLFFALYVGISPFTYAMTSLTDSGYNTPVYKAELNFTATSNSEGDVDMTWDSYAPAGFNYYKVVRSTTNENPVYPEDSYIKADSNPDASSYTDTNVPDGTKYYRVCSIAKPNRYCSKVVSISSDGASSIVTKPETTTTKVEPVTIEPATLALTASMEDDGVQLDWTIDGSSPKGFKVTISTVNENPTYPVMTGDTYRYFTDPAKRSYMDIQLTPGKVYHYRVCQYDGAGKCLAYSNSVSVEIPSDYIKPTTEKVEAEVTKTTAEPVKTYTVIKTTTAFTDASTHQYKTAVEYLREKAIVNGYDDGTYRPDALINRAEFMKIVVGARYATDLSKGVEAYCFFDVMDDWYAPYVCLAKQKKIVSGYDDGYFRPARDISFVEAAKILSEAYGLNVSDGNTWYEGYVRALQTDNYIPSTVNRLDKPITRAEMAELIWRIKEQKKDQAATNLLSESATAITGSTESGWATYNGDGFTVSHPNWYQSEKWGWDLLTDEKDFIDNINVPNYMNVDSYISLYTVAGSDLNTKVWFSHPFVSSTELTINGTPALKRHYRAPRGTVVNGRTTGENENITIYTYQLNGKVAVLQYFNAYGTDNYNVDMFYKIAETFRAK